MIAPYNCVVVATAVFRKQLYRSVFCTKLPSVIACDGAIEALDKAGITPAAIVGDLDSIPSCFRERYADRIHIVEDQEINDLTKSVRFAHRSGEQEVLILGATGLREDHTLGNISLLMDYARLFRRIEMLSDYGIFTPLRPNDDVGQAIPVPKCLFSHSPLPARFPPPDYAGPSATAS